MSNTQTRKSKFATWDELVKEASKPPYQLPLPDGETLTINQPTGTQMFDAQEMAAGTKPGTARDQLRVIVGDDAYESLMPLVEVAPGDAVGLLVSRIMEHFGQPLGEA